MRKLGKKRRKKRKGFRGTIDFNPTDGDSGLFLLLGIGLLFFAPLLFGLNAMIAPESAAAASNGPFEHILRIILYWVMISSTNAASMGGLDAVRQLPMSISGSFVDTILLLVVMVAALSVSVRWTRRSGLLAVIGQWIVRNYAKLVLVISLVVSLGLAAVSAVPAYQNLDSPSTLKDDVRFYNKKIKQYQEVPNTTRAEAVERYNADQSSMDKFVRSKGDSSNATYWQNTLKGIYFLACMRFIMYFLIFSMPYLFFFSTIFMAFGTWKTLSLAEKQFPNALPKNLTVIDDTTSEAALGKQLFQIGEKIFRQWINFLIFAAIDILVVIVVMILFFWQGWID